MADKKKDYDEKKSSMDLLSASEIKTSEANILTIQETERGKAVGKKKGGSAAPPNKPKPAGMLQSMQDKFERLKEEGSRLTALTLGHEQQAANANANPYLATALDGNSPFPVPPPGLKRKPGRPKKDGSSAGNSPARPPDTPPKSALKRSSGTLPTTAGLNPSGVEPPTDQALLKEAKEKNRKIAQIRAYVKLYPALIQEVGIPPEDYLQNCSLPYLADLHAQCKKIGNPACRGDEYEFLKKGFLFVLGLFEYGCSLAVFMIPPQHALYHTIRVMSSQPNGTFASYVDSLLQADDPMAEDLKEISIDLIGLLPKNAYARLALKVGYKMYDYSVYMSNDTYRRARESFYSRDVSPEEAETMRLLAQQYEQSQ